MDLRDDGAVRAKCPQDDIGARRTIEDQPDTCRIVTRLLEIGILAADDNDCVIHAMPARPKYLNLIEPRRGDQR